MTDIPDHIGKRACEIANEKFDITGCFQWPVDQDKMTVRIAIAALMETPPEPPKDGRVDAFREQWNKWFGLGQPTTLDSLFACLDRIGLIVTREEWENRNAS